MINKFIFILLIIISACASVSSPGGGPKDEKPPTLISSSPFDQSTNFNQETIILEFDERVVLKNYEEELLITPRLENPVEAKVKKNTVELLINNTLDSNTTYTFSFREAIQDLTEGNPSNKLKIAFSTGQYIDSAYISGNIVDLLTKSIQKDVLVGAYFLEDTLSILNYPPDYLTITDDSGNFLLSNLKKGKYRIYALKDKNKDSILDFKSEEYGFLSDTIKLDSTVTDLTIPITKLDQRQIELQSSRGQGRYFLARYNKTISNYILSTKDSLTSTLDEDSKGIKFYHNQSLDSLEVILTVFDSLRESSSTDTIMVKFEDPSRKASEYIYTTEVDPIIVEEKLLKLEINFNKPSRLLEQDSLFIELDSGNVIYPVDSSFLWNKKNTTLKLTQSLALYLNDSSSVSKSKIVFGENAFTSIETDSSEASSSKLKWIQTEETGIIEVTVKTDKPSYIIELLNDKYEVVDSRKNISKLSFTKLAPANYILRVLIDKNEDGLWSPGNILNNIEPEPVIIYKKSDGTSKLNLKANWVLGPHEIVF